MCVYINQKVVGRTLGKTIPYSLAFGFCLPSWDAGRVPVAWAVLREEKTGPHGLAWLNSRSRTLSSKFITCSDLKSKSNWKTLRTDMATHIFCILTSFKTVSLSEFINVHFCRCLICGSVEAWAVLEWGHSSRKFELSPLLLLWAVVHP